MKLRYSVVKGDEMTREQWLAVSQLFSTEYGTYSKAAPVRAGEPIRLGPKYYERNYATPDYRAALCYDGGTLVGEALYHESETSRGQVAVVVQLVVAKGYRKHGIASTMLHSVWGFSNYYAWGIVTSNAFTVEALEAATFRRTNPKLVAERIEWLKREVLANIPFMATAAVCVNEHSSRMATNFFTDRTNPSAAALALAQRLGELPEGEEWLAMVFRDQPLDDIAAYRNMIDASSTFVQSAYAQMPQRDEGWAKATASEVDAILELVPNLKFEDQIVDFGAGSGRHVAEFRKRGFKKLLGIDFALQKNADVAVIEGDCRTWKGSDKADLILCLYDVIGSFADDVDNEKIVRNIVDNLASGGRAVISVSNYDYLNLTEIGKIDFDNPEAALQAIFQLPPSKTMQTTGEFFDGNYLLVDEKRHLVCHKEQFCAGRNALSGEYLIRDRRYVMDEIVRLMERCGFEIQARKYVRAGFKGEESPSSGKEILVVGRCAR